jgi:hypothetical protein
MSGTRFIISEAAATTTHTRGRSGGCSVGAAPSAPA